MEQKSETSQAVADMQANPIAHRVFSKIAARGEVTAEEAIMDFGSLMEARANGPDSDIPEVTTLTDTEKNMNFADLIQHKICETEGSCKEDVDNKVRELQEKYKLSEKETSILVDEMGSSLKGAGGGPRRRRGGIFKKLLKFSFKLVTLGLFDDE